MSSDYLITNVVPIFFLLASGLIIRQSLIFSSQMWAKTYHHSLSFFLLPVCTFIITKVIAGNIALSLGMIGALSIVRFRNPVKNPLELVIYFCLITLGIAASVNIKLAIILLMTTCVVIIFSIIYSKFKQKKNVEIFAPSFEEAYSINIIEIISKKEIRDLNNFNIIYFNYNNEQSLYEYKISEREKDKIIKIEKILENLDFIINYEIRYSFN